DDGPPVADHAPAESVEEGGHEGSRGDGRSIQYCIRYATVSDAGAYPIQWRIERYPRWRTTGAGVGDNQGVGTPAEDTFPHADSSRCPAVSDAGDYRIQGRIDRYPGWMTTGAGVGDNQGVGTPVEDTFAEAIATSPRRARTRERLLDAALTIFAEAGVDAT